MFHLLNVTANRYVLWIMIWNICSRSFSNCVFISFNGNFIFIRILWMMITSITGTQRRTQCIQYLKLNSEFKTSFMNRSISLTSVSYQNYDDSSKKISSINLHHAKLYCEYRGKQRNQSVTTRICYTCYNFNWERTWLINAYDWSPE